MPIPGSVLGSNIPYALSKVAGNVYESLATLRPESKTKDTTGQWVHTFVDSTDPTQVNLPCRLSPLILVRPQDQEKQTPTDQKAQGSLQLNFASYVNVPRQTLLKWQVKVDGNVYQIKAVDSDGSKATTRFMVADTNQFQA